MQQNKSILDRIRSKVLGDNQNVAEEMKALAAKLEDEIDKNISIKGIENEYTGEGKGQYGVDFNSLNINIDSTMLQKLYATETWVYAAVNAIADTIAALPFVCEKETTVSRKVINDATGETETVSEKSWVRATGEPLQDLFDHPNKQMTAAELKTASYVDLMTTGEIFLYLDSDGVDLLDETVEAPENSGLGRLRRVLNSETPVKEIYRLPPTGMVLKFKKDSPEIESYHMIVGDKQFTFKPQEIIHIKLFNPLNPSRGLSPLIPAFRKIILEKLSDESIINFQKSGSRLGGVIETDKSLNKEQIDRLQRSFQANYHGKNNSFKTLILPHGMKYNTVQQNPIEGAVLEFSKANRDAILSTLNVPPIKVGIMDNANYANAKVQMQMFFDNTIKPKIALFQDGINNKESLMPDSGGYRMVFDLSEVESLRENYSEKATAGKSMIESGLSVNEVRKKVWNLSPIEGGQKVKVIEDMNKPASGGFFGASMPKDGVDAKDAEPTGMPGHSFIDNLPSTSITAIMNIVGRVSKGKITPEAGATLLLTVYGLPEDAIETMLGYKFPDVVKAPEQADMPMIGAGVKPTEGTFSSRVTELTAQFIVQGIPVELAVPKAIEQAKLEGFNEGSVGDTALSGDGAQAISGEAALQDQVAETLSESNSEIYANGQSKAQIQTHWKTFVDKADGMIEQRLKGVQEFFKKFESRVTNALGDNVKAYGLFKVRTKSDADEIIDEEDFDELAKFYAKNIDAALIEAYVYGHQETLTEFKFGAPNKDAKKFLEKYAAERVTGIIDTTKEQLKVVISEAFQTGVSIPEVASRIREKFSEISAGRAKTIARTEVLTAVSQGQQEKREQVKKEFPERKLQKMWVSAQDEKVRDTHEQYDGQVVDEDEEFAPNLKYPRDPDCEDASEVINCRCTTISMFAEDAGLVQDTLDQSEEEKGWGGAREGAGRPAGSGSSHSTVNDTTPVRAGDRISEGGARSTSTPTYTREERTPKQVLAEATDAHAQAQAHLRDIQAANARGEEPSQESLNGYRRNSVAADRLFREAEKLRDKEKPKKKP